LRYGRDGERWKPLAKRTAVQRDGKLPHHRQKRSASSSLKE
jgi:hypothetical protein